MLHRIVLVLVGLILIISFISGNFVHAQGTSCGQLQIGASGKIVGLFYGEDQGVTKLSRFPNFDSDAVGHVPLGAIVVVLDKSCGEGDLSWIKVNYQGTIGWLLESGTISGEGGSSFITFIVPVGTGAQPVSTGNTLCAGAPPSRVTVGSQAQRAPNSRFGNGRVRSGPSQNYQIVRVANFNEVFSIIGGPSCGGDSAWWKVQFADGFIGWIMEGFMESDGPDYYIEPVGGTPSQPEQVTFASYENCQPDLRPLPDGRKRNWFDLLSNGWSKSRSVVCAKNGEISYVISAFGGASDLEQEGSVVAYVTISYTPQFTGSMTIESDIEVNGTGSVGSGSSFAVKDAVEFISNTGSFLFATVIGSLSSETLATIKDLVDRGISASQLSTGSLNTRVFMTAITDKAYTTYDGLDGPSQTAFPLGPLTSNVTYQGRMAHLTLTVPVVAGQKINIRAGLETVVQAHGWSLVAWNLRRQSSYVKAISLKANS